MSVASPKLEVSPVNTRLIVWTLLLLTPLVGFAIDLIAPSLPPIAEYFHVSNKLSGDLVSIYILGYGLGNFLTGFLTDAWGRKILIRSMLIGFILCSLLPALFPNMDFLLTMRFLQGITLGGFAVLIRAVLSDVLPSERLVHLGTLIGTMWGLGPVMGPVIGGYLQFYLGWKAGFYFFAIVAFLGLMIVWKVVPETHHNLQPLNLSTIRKNMKEVVSSHLFVMLAVLMGLAYSLIITFQTLGPFLIQTVLNHSPIFFGHLALFLGVCFLAATFLCRYLLKNNGPRQIFFGVIHTVFLIVLLGWLAGFWIKNLSPDWNLILIILISLVTFGSCGFLFPLSMGKGMTLFRHIQGTAAAVMYLINMGLTSLTSFLVTFIPVKSPLPILSVDMGLMVLIMGIYWVVLSKN